MHKITAIERSALLSGKEAHLWLVNSSDISTDSDNELLLRLSKSEQHHYKSLKIPEVKREYLLTRALVRSALSQYAHVEPLEWKFEVNSYGRPQLAQDFSGLQLNFNVSHSHGVITCLIAWQHQVGLDVETQNRDAEFYEFLDEVLISCEQEFLKDNGNEINFLHYWTIKEAYSKAIGRGLSMPLKDIICLFGHEVDLPELVEFIQLQKNAWQFLHVPVLKTHLLAIALCKATSDDVAIRLIESMPGLGDMNSRKLLENTFKDNRPHLYIRNLITS